MSESVFTFAELDFLLSNDPSWAEHRESMQLPPGENKAVQFAGLASLLARGQARVEGENVVVTDDVAATSSLLRACTEKISLAAMTDNKMFSTSMFAYSADRERRLLNSTIAPGVVEVRPLRPDVDLLEMFTGIAMSVIQDQGGVLALAHGETVLQIQHKDDAWSWGTAPDQEPKSATEDEVRAEIETRFGPILAI